MILEMTFLILILVVALLIARAADLFAIVILSSIFSVLCAVTYLIMNAPDVALTEAAVGACASTCITLAALKYFKVEVRFEARSVAQIVLCTCVFIVLSYSTLSIHEYGDDNAVTNQHAVAHYKQHVLEEVHTLSLVSAILASCRGFDTFGETLVIFTAGLCVLLILTNINKLKANYVHTTSN